jgi:transposase
MARAASSHSPSRPARWAICALLTACWPTCRHRPCAPPTPPTTATACATSPSAAAQRRSSQTTRNNPTRKNPQPFDTRAYKARNIIERTIGRLKDWRRIHIRYDKLAANFASAVAIAAILLGWT